MQRSVSNSANSGTAAHPACASCKHQRKKCGEDCILAPYFPAERSREFQAVHKVFGVSNVMKLVRSVKEEDRKTVADSLVWEAFCRQNDPILGPLGEYRKIQEELKLYKNQTQTQTQNQTQTQTQILNQNQLVQQQQGSMIYKGTPGMVAWNNGINGVNNKGIEGGLPTTTTNNNNMVNFSHENGSMIYSSYPLNYVQGPEKIMKQEKDVSSRLLPLQPQQHHSIATGFNHQQQYYLPGNYFFNSV